MTDVHTYRMQTKQLAKALHGNYHLVANLSGCTLKEVVNVLSMNYMNSHIYDCAFQVANQLKQAPTQGASSATLLKN